MFGNWSIDWSLFNWMLSNIPFEYKILELGSGESTQELIKKWSIISVEENIEWVGKFHQNYIHAPIVDDFYDLTKIKVKKIDCILVDGPAHGDRKKLFNNLDFFMKMKPKILVFDDLDRSSDLECYNDILNKLSKLNQVESDIIKENKNFGFIKINY